MKYQQLPMDELRLLRPDLLIHADLRRWERRLHMVVSGSGNYPWGLINYKNMLADFRAPTTRTNRYEFSYIVREAGTPEHLVDPMLTFQDGSINIIRKFPFSMRDLILVPWRIDDGA